MVDKVYEIKNRLIAQIEKDMGERGVERIDPEMVDMVKDLAEAEESCWKAEYYRAVTEAMQGRSGYMPEGMAYARGARYESSDWQGQNRNRSRRGYDSMGHGDSLEGVRNMLSMAGPEERERMKAELRSMLEK